MSSSQQGGAPSSASDLRAAFQFKPETGSPSRSAPLPTGLPEVPFDLALSLTPDLLLQPTLTGDLSQLTSANLAGLILPHSLADNGSSSPGGMSRSQGGRRRRASTQRSCQFPGCGRFAHGPQFTHCLRHGGGYRCQFPGCTKSAYSTKFCSRHGGGPRCQFPGGCVKGAISNSSFCRRHGGGKRCAHPSCIQGARQGFNYCLGHGGYNPCTFPSCPLPALHSSSYCRQHNTYQKKMASSQILSLNHGLFGVDDFASVLASQSTAGLQLPGGPSADSQPHQ